MGVRGLTTYIAANADRYLDEHELHDCNVVIDGDSLSCQLYKSINSAFGGNYDHYFRVVCNFFGMLKQCNITAYVLLDGGYQAKKLSTVKQRLRSKIGAIKHLNPLMDSQPTFPIMMREVFVEALEHCHVLSMRCIFEADDEVAALSRKLKCPVLSFDSDFYIHNVQYIPSVTLSLKVFRRNIPDEESKKKVRLRKELVSEINSDGDYDRFKGTEVKRKCYYYMQCSMYRIANLTRDKGLRSEMLPLFAILLGNDYVPSSIFKKFYLNVSMKKTGKNSTKQGKRIIALLRWLQHETLASAIDKIINHVEKDKKVWLREQINNGISGYIHEKSMAYDYFGFSSNEQPGDYLSAATIPDCLVDTTLEEDADTGTLEEEEVDKSDHGEGEDDDNSNAVENDDEDDNSSSSDSDTESEPLESDSDDNKDEIQPNSKTHDSFDTYTPTNETLFVPPEWLLKKILAGQLPRYVVDLMTMRLYVNNCQVENFLLPDCNAISVPILQLIFTILHQPYHREFRYLTRVQRRTDIEYKRFESLSVDREFDTASDKNRKFFELILRDFENSETIFKVIEETVPSDIRLLFIAIIYWARYSKHCNVVYVCSLLLCQIVLTEIDSRLEPTVRDRRKFEKIFNPNGIKGVENAKKNVDENELSIEECKKDVTRNECIVTQFNRLLELFSISDKLRTKHTEFSSDIVHGFGEFQSIVYQLNCLNVLCGEPYSNIVISKCFNGCFLFNMYSTLKERPNIRYFIKTFLFPASPNLLNLFKAMMLVLTPFVGCLSSETISKRKKRRNINKKKSREQRKNNVTANDDEHANADEEDPNEAEFEDLNNRFSCLMKM
ncbi:protein asteroid [Sitodiplosis mosellana]|uniref:protein asteroid n=1 Tax=Sitodiplosis mosellana TaxID=263140 RepID=UPI002444DB93|nr:protein asteroid [Sitodiplosis mosellana]